MTSCSGETRACLSGMALPEGGGVRTAGMRKQAQQSGAELRAAPRSVWGLAGHLGWGETGQAKDGGWPRGHPGVPHCPASCLTCWALPGPRRSQPGAGGRARAELATPSTRCLAAKRREAQARGAGSRRLCFLRGWGVTSGLWRAGGCLGWPSRQPARPSLTAKRQKSNSNHMPAAPSSSGTGPGTGKRRPLVLGHWPPRGLGPSPQEAGGALARAHGQVASVGVSGRAWGVRPIPGSHGWSQRPPGGDQSCRGGGHGGVPEQLPRPEPSAPGPLVVISE